MKLGDVCIKIGSGATPRGGQGVYLDVGPYSLIRSQNVRNEGFARDGLASIGERHAHELRNVAVQASDVLINVTGDSVARVCQVPDEILPARVNQHVAIIRPDPNRLDARFLRYWFVSPAVQSMMLSWAGSGGTRNALTKEMIESFEVDAPPLPEQRAIAHILGTLDDKIELNRKMNQTLEEMARALFKSWFVDFDPVRAKLDGRWRPGESLPGLPADLYHLFPDRLVPSQLGEIPVGWEVRELGEYVESTKGRSYRKADLVPSDTALVTLKSFARGGGYQQEGLKSYAGPYKSDQVVESGDVVIACTDVTQAAEVIGRPALVRQTSEFATLVASLDTVIIRPNYDWFSKPFVYLLCDNDRFVTHTGSFTNGTTVLHLSKEAVTSFEFPVPGDAIVGEFTDVVGPLLKKIDDNEQASTSIANVRNNLLPKLVSGELPAVDHPSELVG